MIEVTATAITKFKEQLAKNNSDSAIRVFMQNGCSGVSLGLAMDEQKDSDQVFVQDGLTFLVDGGILAKTGAIKIDFTKSTSGCGCGGGGFSVSSERKQGGGGCGDSCSSGSCC